MRSHTVFSLLCSFLLLASVAWSWPDFMEDVFKRDESTTTGGSTESATSTTSGPTAQSGSTGTVTGTAVTTSSTDSGTNTGTAASTQSGQTTTGSSSDSKTTSSTSISVDPRLPAGGASLTNPVSTSTTYYKIGQNVTFGWNYTSLVNSPTAVDVIATCSSNSATYTLANNMSIATQSVIWQTHLDNSSSSNPLLTAYYTLIIYEAGTSPTEVASAGALGPAMYTFGMYLPQAYVNLTDYVCVTCNAASSNMERQALGFMFTMMAITVVSFTAFAGGFGVFS